MKTRNWWSGDMEQITREEVIRALSFFRSAIQSGEEWSPGCDALYEHITTALQAAEPDVILDYEFDDDDDPDSRGDLVFHWTGRGEFPAGTEFYAQLPCPPAKVSLSDAEINGITKSQLGQWPSFEAQSWACKVAKAVLTAMAQPAKAQVPDEQVAFEEWARTDPLLGEHELDRNPEDSDDYDNLFTQAAWNAWQARAMLTASPAPEHTADVRKMVHALEIARDYVVEHLTKRREEFKGYEKLGGIAEIEADLVEIEEALAPHRKQEETER